MYNSGRSSVKAKIVSTLQCLLIVFMCRGYNFCTPSRPFPALVQEGVTTCKELKRIKGDTFGR